MMTIEDCREFYAREVKFAVERNVLNGACFASGNLFGREPARCSARTAGAQGIDDRRTVEAEVGAARYARARRNVRRAS